MNFTRDWQIRKGDWIEKDRKKYYLKEFDDYTPVGELKIDNPASKYQSLKVKNLIPKPIPLIKNLPEFKNTPAYKKKLKWHYQNRNYAITISIPEEQLAWTRNLPPSLYGMVSSGIEELKNTEIINKLKFLASEFAEYEKVNFLLKFCQSESIFVYDKNLPIKSISQQLLDGRNDCDGRSVFLYCLLYTVLEYNYVEIIFTSWSNHLALGLKPKTEVAKKTLKKSGFSVGDEYYILDATYAGETFWGSKMKSLPSKCEVIPIPKANEFSR